MIYIKTDYYAEDKEIVEELIKLLNKTVNNFCAEHSQAFVIQNNATVVGVAIKAIL